MTCVVGLIDNESGTVYMGGDSAAYYSDGTIRCRADPKVFIKTNNKFIYGFCSSFRMGDILKHYFVEPEHPQDMPIDDYMRVTYIDALQVAFKQKGFHGTGKNQPDQGGNFAVGYAGKLFTVESDFQVAESLEPHTALGSGAREAMGSLFSTQKTKMSSEARILLALESAEKYTSGVRAPFTIKSLNWAEKRLSVIDEIITFIEG